jgi:integrase
MRSLPSGRWQASYVGPDLARHSAPYTFESALDAEGWLASERRLLASDEPWTPPKERHAVLRLARTADGLTLREFAPDALARRRTRGVPLRPRTMQLYRGLLERVIYPTFGDVAIRKVTPEDVEAWWDALPADRPTQNAHSYALLRSLFAEAASARERPRTGVRANPCMVKGAGVSRRQREINTATLDELADIVQALPDRVRALVLLCAWCGLRFGEVAELRRGDVDLTRGLLRVRRALVRVDGADTVGPPKSDAGARDVAIPPHLLPVLSDHLAEHVGRGRAALLFPHHPGTDKHWTHGMFYKLWMPARAAAGRPDLRLHDLRHTAAVLAAQTGATLAELMARLGHSTSVAAMRYQTAAQGRDAQIAAALSRMAGHGTA